MPVIETKDLSKEYYSSKLSRQKINALNNFTFNVEEGEIFGLLGPNGAGKTTLIKMLLAITFPTRGTAKIFGLDASSHKWKNKVGYLPEKVAFYEDLTARENLELMGDLYNVPKPVMEEKIDYYLRLVGLEASADRYTGGFSGGMKQRLSVIAAVLHDPQILFWDEPSTGLDPQTRNVIWKLARKFNGEGKTLIFTTHYMEEADNLCNRVAVMDSGKMVALDDPDILKEKTGSTNLEEVFVHFTGEEVRD